MQNAKCKIKNEWRLCVERWSACVSFLKKRIPLTVDSGSFSHFRSQRSLILHFALCILHFVFSTSFVPHFPPFVNPLRPFYQKFFKNRPNPLYKSPKMCYTVCGQDHGTADALGEVVTNRIPLLPARPYAVRHHRGGLIFCPHIPRPEAGRRYII